MEKLKSWYSIQPIEIQVGEPPYQLTSVCDSLPVISVHVISPTFYFQTY